MKLIQRSAAITAIAVLALLGGTTAASATTNEAVIDELVISGGTGSASLVLDFDDPITQAEADDIEESLEQEPMFSARAAEVIVRCNDYKSWVDTNGTFTYQRACGSASGPWSFKISIGVRGIVVGDVVESGLSWSVNGVTKPKQSPHTVPASYLFHGTFSGLPATAKIKYSDTITFRHNQGGGGSGKLTIGGEFTSTK